MSFLLYSYVFKRLFVCRVCLVMSVHVIACQSFLLKSVVFGVPFLAYNLGVTEKDTFVSDVTAKDQFIEVHL